MKNKVLASMLVLFITIGLISNFEITVHANWEKGSPDIIWLEKTYENIDPFSEGLALVRLNSKYGFIDKTGKEVIPLKYDNAFDFSEGLALVWLNEKCGYIDKTGKEVIPIKYDWCGSFSEDLALVVLDDKWGYIDKTGKEIIPLRNDYNCSRVYGFFAEGFTMIKTDNHSKEKWGYMDKTGKNITPIKYDSADYFHEGLAKVEINKKRGYIDKTGKEIVPLIYDYVYASNFNESVVIVRLNDKWGIMKNPLNSENKSKENMYLANPISSKILVNNDEIAFEAYTINGNNYFKLRDIAYVLKGTKKQFEVGWDSSTGAISLASGKTYTAVSEEMSNKGTGIKTPIPTSSKIYLDGKEVQFTAYTIDNNNYFKLRDIGESFDFNVSWDGINKTILINTAESYTAD